MPRKKSHLTVTDQFCGAGGSSQGVRRAAQKMNGGLEVSLALNHWKLAIETHSTNFPEAIHDCTDISASDPRRYPSTDFLVTSPECTHQGNAIGKKRVKQQLDLYEKRILDPAAERSRATMWDVPRFAEYHNYNIIIAENVTEAREWITFESWLHAMDKLGYNHKICYLNSMFFHPTPQSRDRMYVVFWKKGNKAPNLEFTPPAHCRTCGKDVNAIQWWKRQDKRSGKYKFQYIYRCPYDATVVTPYYYAAFNCIDWSDLGEPIYNRKRGPLSPNTIRRCKTGLDRHGYMPLMVKLEHTSQLNVRPVDQSIQTQTTADSQGFFTPVIKGVNANDLVWPFIIENKGQSTARSIAEPISTITTHIYHGIVTSEAFNSFITYYNSGSDVSHAITEACGTIPTKSRLAICNYRQPTLEDCFYRSLKAPEVKIGMGFDHSYIIKGNSKEQIRQCGNAVTPPAMEWLVEQCVKSLS